MNNVKVFIKLNKVTQFTSNVNGLKTFFCANHVYAINGITKQQSDAVQYTNIVLLSSQSACKLENCTIQIALSTTFWEICSITWLVKY